MADNLIERVLKTIRSYDMLKGQPIAIAAAVSGGPDSVFLIHALFRLKNKLGIEKLAVCNLDHGLRGKESGEDSVFVKKLAKELSLPFVHKKINLRRIQGDDLSIEEIGREARYNFFKEAARKVGANIIATGHTLDDQAETILMRLIRGSALKGLVGIPPTRKFGALSVIRPLLELEKGEIEEFLRKNNIECRIDRTNLESAYFRNIVRHKIIPFLEQYNPRLKRALFNLSQHLLEDFQYIDEKRSQMRNIIHQGDSRVEVKLKDIVIQPNAIQKEILRDSLEKAGGEVKKLSFRHWKEMEHLIKHKGRGSSLDLPGGIRITKTAASIELRRL